MTSTTTGRRPKFNLHRDGFEDKPAPPSAPVGVEGLADADIKWDMRHIEPHLKDADAAIPVLLQGVRRAIKRALAQQHAAVDGAGVDWRAMYRFQTAMRYMDNNPNLSKQKADRMADDNVAGLESANAQQPQGDNT